MNFELKTMDVAQAASEKCDLLVLLVPDGFAPGKDALGDLVAQAIEAMNGYQAGQEPAFVPSRWCSRAARGAGRQSVRAMRAQCAMVAAVAPALKQGAPKRAVVCVAGAASAAAVEAVVRGVAQASYVYTRPPSPRPARAACPGALVGVHDARAMSAPLA